MRTPVAFFIFNRPETTERVFEAIRQAQPPVLLVVADGPRAGRSGEAEKCAAARSIVARVDWNCAVKTDFAAANLGCKRRLSSGLDWVFQQTPEAIILEDDCLPHPSFFPYCDELLQRYSTDERVMHIGGIQFLPDVPCGEDSYCFSRYPLVWGWASWRRAWRHYDVAMPSWSQAAIRADHLKQFTNSAERRYWQRAYEAVFQGQIDTWDYQWVFACQSQRGLSIMPRVNLVSNIGFGFNSAHTADAINPRGNMPTQALKFPLKHPQQITRNTAADERLGRSEYVLPNLYGRIKNRLVKELRQICG